MDETELKALVERRQRKREAWTLVATGSFAVVLGLIVGANKIFWLAMLAFFLWGAVRVVIRVWACDYFSGHLLTVLSWPGGRRCRWH